VKPPPKPDFASMLRGELAKLEEVSMPEIVGIMIDPAEEGAPPMLRRATVLLLRDGRPAIVRVWAIGG